MKIGDLLALGALLVAVMSAIYARHARDAAREANEIARHQTLRPLRVAVYEQMKDFSGFCAKYRTLQTVGAVTGIRDLVERIEDFQWELERKGPLGMKDVEEKAENFVNEAWKMQRLFDRLAGGQDKPIDRDYQSAEENLDAVLDWFGIERRKLMNLFAKHLEVA